MPLKAPGVKDSFGYDYTNELAGETITASSWTADAELTLTSPTFDDTSTTVWIAGGSLGETLTATNNVTTSGGRELSHVITLFIRSVVNPEDDHLAIASDLVAKWAPLPAAPTSDYYARAARAERLVANYLTQTGGALSGASLSGVGSVSYSGDAMKNIRSIIRETMGDYYTAGGVMTVTVSSSFPETTEGV